MRGKSEVTIKNYKYAITRFLNRYDEKTNISKLTINDIIRYFKKDFIDKNLSVATYNVNLAAVRFFYLICFERGISKVLLPNSKLRKRFPKIVTKELFLKIINNEDNLEHKCWLLLSFCCGLRISEVATIKIEDIYSKEHKLRVLGKGNNQIRNCKKEELGFHTITCKDCGKTLTGFNSCRNRHCPMCQVYAREKWIDNESSYLLNCPYFHIVTTIPSELNELALYNEKLIYNILFKSTSESILELAKDPKWLGAKIGGTSILHTWGSNMEFHPHVHFVITGGGINNNKWIESNNKYLFKVQVLSHFFKSKFLGMLKQIHNELIFPDNLSYLKDFKKFNDFLRPLYNKTFITYIEPPKGNKENVIEYLGRYAFRVAISNNRIIDISDGIITFEYKDYKDNGNIKIMKLSSDEFIRRFLLHVLPKNFTKIIHYGLLANRNKKTNIKLCRILIGQKIFSDFTIPRKRKPHKYICENCGNDEFIFKFFYPLRL